MHHTIEFGGHPQDVTITTSGPASLEGFVRLNDELVADPRFRPGMFLLVDHSALDVSPLSHDDVAAIGRHVLSLGPQFGPAVSAIVGGDLLTIGLAKISVAHAMPSELHARTFESREAALEWLREERAIRGEG